MAKFKEPFSGFTHMAGAIFAAAAFGILLYHAIVHGNAGHIVSYSIFGLSMLALYTASTLYHLIHDPPVGRPPLRTFDHLMIYVLIAGTYTPICVVALHGPWGWSILSSIWFLAACGMFAKGFWHGMPRWISTLIYVIMGWLIVITIWPLGKIIGREGIYWLMYGGLFYSVGAIIYGLKRPNPWPGLFGYHEIWHFFVLGGTVCHFWLVLKYLTPVR